MLYQYQVRRSYLGLVWPSRALRLRSFRPRISLCVGSWAWMGADKGKPAVSRLGMFQKSKRSFALAMLYMVVPYYTYLYLLTYQIRYQKLYIRARVLECTRAECVPHETHQSCTAETQHSHHNSSSQWRRRPLTTRRCPTWWGTAGSSYRTLNQRVPEEHVQLYIVPGIYHVPGIQQCLYL